MLVITIKYLKGETETQQTTEDHELLSTTTWGKLKILGGQKKQKLIWFVMITEDGWNHQ